MIKTHAPVTTILLPKDLNSIPPTAPEDWHQQNAAMRGGAPNITDKDWTKEPITDEEHARRMSKGGEYAVWFRAQREKRLIAEAEERRLNGPKKIDKISMADIMSPED